MLSPALSVCLRERELIGVGERLIAEYQDRVFVHARPDPIERVAVMSLAQIDPGHFRSEVWIERAKGDAHAASLEFRARHVN
jgi:hypothetical protein